MRIKIFYGWYIVLAGLLLSTYYSAVFTYGWTSFVTPILSTFGWSMTQLSLASTLRGVEAGIFNPLWGVAVDRWSPQKLMMFSVFLTSIGMFLISRSTSLITYYLGFMVMGIASSSVTSMIPTATIARWFKKDLGKANGLYYVGIGIGGVLVPLLTMMIDSKGWQTTLFYSAIGFLIIGIPLSFVYRSRPEVYGMVPDGKKPETFTKSGASPDHDVNLGVKDVLKMRIFWFFNIIILFQSAVLGIVSLYAMPYLENQGFSRANASIVVSMFTIASVCSRMPVGMLGDIFRKKHVITLTLGMVTFSLFLFWLMNAHTPFWITVLFAIFYGVGISGIMPLRMPIMVEYFGSRNIGAIFGLASIFSTIGGITAVPLTGWVFDTYHDYRPVLLALVAFGIAAVILMMVMPSAARKAQVAKRAV